MIRRILIAHANGDEAVASAIAAHLSGAGYEVTSSDTVQVGGSVIAELSKLLAEGVPVVVCGTVKAVGTGWAEDLINAARHHPRSRIFPLRIERDARVQRLLLDERIAEYWEDPQLALSQLTTALAQYYPTEQKEARPSEIAAAERRYREFALHAYGIL